MFDAIAQRLQKQTLTFELKKDLKDLIKFGIHQTKDIALLGDLTLKTPNLAPAIQTLPKGAFYIQTEFKLTTPYLSKDDTIFYPTENSIRKEKVFGVPYVAASAWKGALRAALWQLGHQKDNDQIIRLFGNDRESEDTASLSKGRCYFYPSYFGPYDKQEVLINPHDRKTRKGKLITYEGVSADQQSVFSLLYVPINNGDGNLEKDSGEDFKLLTSSINAMFSDFGFGAKTSSGFGRGKVAEIKKDQYCHLPKQVDDQKSTDESDQSSANKTRPQSLEDLLNKYQAPQQKEKSKS